MADQKRPAKIRRLRLPASPMPKLLGGLERKLLDTLFRRQQTESLGVNAKRFRADHDDYLSQISDLVSAGWIEEREGFYFVQLVGVAELAPTDTAADSLIFLCRHMYDCLRKAYKDEQDRKIFIKELPKLVDMPLGEVKRALPYLRQASLFGTSSTDLGRSSAYIVLSEELIRHKSFQQILDQHREWASQRSRSRLHTSKTSPAPSRGTIFRQNELGPIATGRRRGKTRARSSPSVRTPLDTYTIGPQIGQGGSGYVLSARSEDGRSVALKYLDPSKKSATLLKRFRNEIRFGQRANHPNIVPVLDVGEAEFGGRATIFFVMPHFPLTLRQAMDRGLLSPELSVRIFEQILAGVEAAHAQGVWHRDLKPENVLLSEDLSEVRIGDFGIAHFSENELYTAAVTKAADRLANFKYAAPEQRDRRAEKDHRADIFSLGLMLSEMLTGEIPHGSEYGKIADKHPTFAYLDILVNAMIRQRATDRPSSIASIRHHIATASDPRGATTRESSAAFFMRRFADSFPGVRGLEVLADASAAVERLRILLRDPLTIDNQSPVWWWRNGDMPIVQFSVIAADTILIDGQELIVDRIAAVNAGSYFQQFVYIQCKPSSPSGLYDYSHVEDTVREFGFAREEFAIYEGKAITRSEYDDGAAIIDGIPVTFTKPAELRVRYLSPYNLLIAPFDSPINNNDFDQTRDFLMNRLLRDEAKLEELVSAVLRLPKRARS